MNINKKISIIIPVYNTEIYFDKCITSILNQTYKNLEIIVISDASPGNIEEIIKKYQKQDKRIKFIKNDVNLGLFKTRLVGMKIASGDYIASIDSDDYLTFDYYRTLVSRAEETKADIVIGRTVNEKNCEQYYFPRLWDSFNFDVMTGTNIQNAFFKQEYRNYSWHTFVTKLYKIELIKHCIPYFEQLNEHIIMTEDIAFSSVLFANAKIISAVKEESYFYCQYNTSSTNSTSANISKYKKNVKDICYVFDFVEKILIELKMDEYIPFVKNGRERFGRLYYPLSRFDNQNDIIEAKKAHIRLSAKNDFLAQDDGWFEEIRKPYVDLLTTTKTCIIDSSKNIVCFNLFETLLSSNKYTTYGKNLYELALFENKDIYIISNLKLNKEYLKYLLSINNYENYLDIFYYDEANDLLKQKNVFFCDFSKNISTINKYVFVNILDSALNKEKYRKKIILYLSWNLYFITQKLKILFRHFL